MHNPLLQDLETNFFGKSRYNQNKQKYDFKNQRSQKIARFLLHSQLNHEISELLIQELLEGKRKIRLKDSVEEVSIASNFSIQDLKQKNLLWILDGKIQVPYIYENKDDLELEQTIQNLANIIYSKGKYEPSKLQISKTIASQLSKQTPNFLKNVDEDHFEFGLKNEEIESVGSELWKLLLSNQTIEQNQKIKKWLTLMSGAFNDHNLFCLNFETQEAEHLFIEASIEYINAQNILKQSWDELYLALLLYNSRFHYHEISGHVPEKLAKLDPQVSIWDAFLWWNSREIEFLANFLSEYYTHWLYFILEKIDQLQNTNLFEYVQSLLDKPFLTHILFAPLGTSLFPILLKEEKMANIGLMILGSSIRQKYFPESDYSLHRYETQRCELFWREGLEIYFSYLDKTMDKQWAGENLAKILLYMSDHFLFNPYLFRFSLDVIATFKNPNKTLVLEKVFDETASCLIESHETKANTQYPANYFSLLLWFLGQSLRIDSKAIEATIVRIIDHLISIYNQLCQKLNLDGLSKIQSHEWKSLLQLATQDQKEVFLNKNPQQMVCEQEFGRLYASNTARIHLKIMLDIFQCESDKNRNYIAQKIIEFCQKAMHIDKEKMNLFSPALYEKDSLPKKLIENINFFPESQRKGFIDFLLPHLSLTNLLFLAQTLSNTNDRNMVLEWLKSPKQDFQTMSEIIESVTISINTPELHKFTDMLFQAWENGTNRHFDYVLHELKGKTRIKKILESDFSNETKIEQINAVANPFDKQKAQVSHDDFEAFKENCLALIGINDNPKLTHQKIKSIILRFGKQQDYALYLLKAHIAMIEQKPANEQRPILYAKALKEWEEFNIEPTNQELLFILEVCIKINDSQTFNQYWSKLPPIYALCDKQFEDIKLRFEQGIKNTKNQKPSVSVETNKRIEDCRKYWLEIKNSRLDFQLEVFRENDMSSQCNPQETRENFIKNTILSVCDTLLNRRNNLRKIENNKKICDENRINDWFASLLRHRFDLVGWYSHDQSRCGDSFSRKNPGEIDLDIYHPHDKRVCLIEALKLEDLDTTKINEHHNKINGYNASGCEMVAFVVYAQSNNFLKLTQGYQDHISKNDYSGYQRKSDHDIIEVETNFANIKLFKEKRLKNESEITFLHFLLDFGAE